MPWRQTSDRRRHMSLAHSSFLPGLAFLHPVVADETKIMINKKLSGKFLTGIVCVSLSSSVSAYNWVAEVKVTSIEVTYLPGSIPFYVDKAVGGCAGGTALTWLPRGNTQDEKNQNMQGISATLLTAKATGLSILVYVIADGCKVEYLYIRAVNKPACASTTDKRWALNVGNNNAANQYIYSGILAAMASGWNVYIVGTNSCTTVSNLEDVAL